MKKIYRIALSAALALAASLTAFVPVTSCDGHHPIEVIQTDYSYSVDADDIHIADGARAECTIHLTSASVRDESITVGYRVDDDAALHVYVNGKEIVSGASVPLDATGSIVLTMPELGEGLHVLHLTLTNRYGKTVSKDVSFQVIRDKVWAKGVSAPAMVKMEKGSYVDTAVAVIPADADILALAVTSSAPDVVRASLAGDGAEKVLRLEGLSDGSASVSLSHEDIEGPAATVAVEVYSYKIEGLPATMSLVEGADATVTLSVMPAAPVTLVSSSPCLSVTTAAGGVWTLQAVSPGTATLVATAGRTQASCVVTVVKKPETIAVSPMSAIIASGGTKAFSVVSSADFTAALSSDAATIIERTATGVTVRNDNRSFRDAKATLTVSNVADPTKRAVADIMLEKRAETITLAESVSEAGRSIWSVGGENDGWTLVSSPSGLRCEATGNTIVLTNATYKSVSGAIVVKTKEQGVTATKDVTVQGLDVKLSSLTADPVSFSIEEGKSVSLVIRGTYNDGTVKDVTNAVTWTQSSNLQRNGNTFYAVEPGSAWVRASLDDKSASIDGNVTKKPVYLNSLEIDPAYFTALVDESRLFSVTANFSDGTHRDVTRDCEWSVTGSAIASGKGYYKFTAPGEVLVEASYTHEGTTLSARSVGSITKPSGTVTGVTVEPKEKRMKVGETVTFSGTVRYSDGTTDASGTFTVSPAGILSGANGSYVAVAEGTVSVTYSYSGYSATAAVTVSANGPGGGNADVVKEIILNTATLTVYAGKASSVTATAVMGDGSAKDVTNQAVWSSSNSGVATVDSFGRITGVKAGTATITVNYSGKSATCSVVVEEEVSLVSVGVTPSSLAFTVGDPSQHVSAKAYFSDGTSRDVTNIGTWSTSDGSVATVSAGTIAPGSEGSATVSCRYQGKEGSCSVRVSRAAVVVTAATMSQSTATLTVGESLSLKVTYKFSDGSSGDYTYASSWSSSNTSVVTVKKGTITAVKPGTATITAYLRSESEPKATCVVTVREQSPTSLVIEPSGSFTLEAGTSMQLRCYSVTSSGSRTDVTTSASWSSSRSTAATVSSGLVTAKDVSSTTSATITASYSGLTASTNVTVTPSSDVVPKSLSINPSKLTLNVGETRSYSATVTYQNNNTAQVSATYSTQNDNIAYFNGTTLIAKSAGSTTVNASYSAGGKTVTATGTVTVNSAPEYKINVSPLNLNFGSTESGSGAKKTFTLTLTNVSSVSNSASGGWFSWNVSADGRTYTVYPNTSNTANQQRRGSITISDNANKAASVMVVITQDADNTIAVTSVTLNKTSLTLGPDESETLKATITPSNATDKTLIWESSNDNVATVDDYGKVTGVSSGKAAITVMSNNWISASCEVTVMVAVTGVEIYRDSERVSGSSINAPLNDGITLTAKVLPEGATNQNVKWSSSDASIVSVTSGGVIMAKKQQTATITVTTEDGGKTASVQVTGYQETRAISADKSEFEWAYDKNDYQTANLTLTNVKSVAHNYSGQDFIVIVNNNDKTLKVKPNGSKNTKSRDISANFSLYDEDDTSVRKDITLTWKKRPNPELAKITISPESVSVKERGSSSLTVSLKDQYENPYTESVVLSWESNDTGTAYGASENGSYVVKGITPGSTTIWAKCGNVTSNKIDVTVTGVYHPVTQFDISQSSLLLEIGRSATLSVTINDDATEKGMTWKSSNESVATVNEYGEVKAVGPGDATITATAKGEDDNGKHPTATCNVNVPEPPVHVTSITMQDPQESYDKSKIDSFNLYADITPSNADNTSIKWSVLNEDVVKIAGEVSNSQHTSTMHFVIVGVGTATIRATSEENSKIYDERTIQVVESESHGSLSFDGVLEYEIPAGKVVELSKTTVLWDNVSNSIFELINKHGFRMDNSAETVCEFYLNNKKAYVRGISAGEANLRLTNNETPPKETTNAITIKVKDPTKITIPYSTTSPLEMNIGETRKVKASLSGNYGSGTWSWTSSNPYLASISGSGDEVSIQGKYVGSADITVSYGDLEATFTVNVKDPGQEDVIVTGLDPQVDGTKVRIVASFMNVVTYAEWTEDVTKDVEITDVSSGLTVTKKSSSPTDYYLLVDAKKNGTFVFTVEYKTESFTLHVTKSSGNISIY